MSGTDDATGLLCVLETPGPARTQGWSWGREPPGCLQAQLSLTAALSHAERSGRCHQGGEGLVDSQGKEPGAPCMRPGLHLALMCTYDVLDFCLDPVPSPAPLK